jgi:DNA polymerase-3 subunit epsilon
VNPARAALDYLLGGPKVGGADEDRWRRWSALPAPPLAAAHGRTRYVVVAAGTVRHALRHERLTSIGAVGVRHGQIDLADCFAVALRQRRAVDALIHGHAGQAAAVGVEPKIAMLDFLDYLGKAPLVAFRAGEDRTIFERAVKSILGVPFRHPWLDLAALLPTLFPQAPCTTRGEWLAHFGIAPAVAQDTASGDAFATAQVFLVTLDASMRAGLLNAAQLIAAQGHLVPGHA